MTSRIPLGPPSGSILLFLLAACSCTSPPSLRVATSGDYRPFSIKTDYGEIVGFETVVARRFAQDSGRPVTFVPLRWSRLVDDGAAGKFDVAMSGITMRPDRALHMFFSRPYAVTGAVVVVRRDRAEEIGSLDEIDRRGLRLAVNRGGHLEQVTRARFSQATIVPVDDNTTLAALVLSGDVDAAVSEEYEATGWSTDLLTLAPFTRDRKAYAVALEHAGLLEELNAWLAARESDGWLNDQRQRWLGPRAVWTPQQACFEAIAAAIDMRLQLMEWVAAATGGRGLPIENGATHEERVVSQANRWAQEVELQEEGVAAVFRRLIEVAKDAPRDTPTAGAPVDLGSLQQAVAAQDRWLIEELGRCEAVLSRPDWRPSMTAALGEALTAPAAESLPAAELAELLGQIRRTAPRAQSAGGFVDFCIPSQLLFDSQGYVAEELVDGKPRKHSLLERLGGAGPLELHAGATRIPVTPGRHEFQIYVDGSSGDPHRVGGPATPPTRVQVDVPYNQVVTVGFIPAARVGGKYELRWQRVFGVAFATLMQYRGVTTFDVDTRVYEPSTPGSPSLCPFDAP